MANCPNCGSEHIQLKKDTNVDWGRAVAGWALFGVVGGAVGAVTGEDRNANACLDCGTSWKAADLYKTLQVINKLTGVNLDLAYQEDRNFINDFINEVTPRIRAISEAEEKGKSIIKNSEDELDVNIAMASFSGCIIYFIVFIILVAITGGLAILFLLIASPFINKKINKQKNIKINKIKKMEKEQLEKLN